MMTRSLEVLARVLVAVLVTGSVACGSSSGSSDTGGTTDTVAADPGTLDPGSETTALPDAFDPGSSDPGIPDPGTVDPGATDPGTVDPGTSDPGTTDPGQTDPGPTDPGPIDPGTIDPGPTDPGSIDPGPAAFACPTVGATSSRGDTMNPGQDCSSCHQMHELAGTVYQPDEVPCGSSNQGVPGVTVEALPSGGGAAVALGTTNTVGTFVNDGLASGTYSFRVSYASGGATYTKTMTSTASVDSNSALGCASCHASGGAAGAPIHL
jgi:hypothetical protein